MNVKRKEYFLATGALAFALASKPPQAIAQTPAFVAIHSFAGSPNDGASPIGPLIQGGKVFYGTTAAGGNAKCGCGAVFSLAPPESPGGHWTEKILYNFSGAINGGTDGSDPVAGVVLGSSGVLYGTTELGGAYNGGTVFSLTQPASPGGEWTETVLHSFGQYPDGRYPVSSLVVGKNGVLYGTASSGGAFRNGEVFALGPPASPGGSWTEKMLYSFAASGDGLGPETLAMDPASGTFYGTTNGGGTALDGTVFSLAPPATAGAPWSEKVIYSFTGGSDGAFPNPIVLGPGGVLYGTSRSLTGIGGAVYSLTPPVSPGDPWSLTVLYDFTGLADGSAPGAGLVMGGDGSLYGTTISGGSGDCRNGCGVVFSLAPPASPGGVWRQSVLSSLDGAGNGPAAPLILGSGGALYGTTKFGGAIGAGIVFALSLQ